MPHPEERTGFAIPNLDQWILAPGNQRKMLWNLLVLVVDWTRNGAPRKTGITMRQFTPWAEAVGGFLAHHGIEGFLGNIQDVRNIDDEDAAWAAFLGQWRKVQGDKQVTTRQLRQSADAVMGVDQWDGLFLDDGRGKIPGDKSLGKRLAGHIDRYHGSYVLRSEMDRHTKIRTWRVEEWFG
jgi:hypothetical protein